MARKDQTAEVVPFQQPTAIVVRSNEMAEQAISQFMQLAADPGVTAEKLNAIIDAKVRIMGITAKQAFDRDFAAMQGKLPIIKKGGKAEVGKIRTTQYARQIDIIKVVRPILARHGFALRFKHRLEGNLLIVTGFLSHKDGHFETDEFHTPRDEEYGKNPIQTWGSARSYGQRYTTVALLCLATEDDPTQDDGAATGETRTQRASEKPAERKPDAPARGPLPSDEKVINDAQLKRFHTIVTNSGRNPEVVKLWLFTTYHLDSSRDIKRKDYDTICSAVENSKQPLVTKGAK